MPLAWCFYIVLHVFLSQAEFIVVQSDFILSAAIIRWLHFSISN